MANILLTNDDGYTSQGFLVLLNELKKEHKVIGVAPKNERSWIGKSISAHNELTLEKVKSNLYSLTGTPADCTQIGIYDVLKNKPNFVISGINLGLNAGHGRILSSGTIGAAMEASIDGVKSISTSIHIPTELKGSLDLYDKKNSKIFINAAKITCKVIKIFINTDYGNNVDLLSLNIPFDATIDSPIEITVPDRQPLGQLFFKKRKNHKLKVPPLLFESSSKGTDLRAIFENKISVTPISLELVSKNSIKNLKFIIKKKW